MQTKKARRIPCLCQDIEQCCHVQTDLKDESPEHYQGIRRKNIVTHSASCTHLIKK